MRATDSSSPKEVNIQNQVNAVGVLNEIAKHNCCKKQAALKIYLFRFRAPPSHCLGFDSSYDNGVGFQCLPRLSLHCHQQSLETGRETVAHEERAPDAPEQVACHQEPHACGPQTGCACVFATWGDVILSSEGPN